MVTPPPQELLPSPMRAALALLQEQAFPAYLVGGWLRDLLLGRESHDVDVAVQGDAFAIAKALAQQLHGTYVPLHDSPHIARVVLRHKEKLLALDISSLTGTLAEDLGRRDFTIDALAMPLERLGESPPLQGVLDPLGGLDDLHHGVVRVVSHRVFQDDPVRLLRAVRLSAQLGFHVEPGTRRLMERDAPLLDGVSGERVRDEFLKTLDADGAVRHLQMLDEVGLLTQILPELDAGRGVQQPKEHHWDVFQHNLETAGMVERVLGQPAVGDRAISLVPMKPSIQERFRQEVCDGFPRRVFLKLAGLLHDTGKPATRTVEPSGRMRFLGHSQTGADLAAGALRRLRIGGKGVALVETIVTHHLRPGQLSQQGEPPSRRAVYRYYRDLGDAALDTLYLNLADYLAARGPNLDVDDWGVRCAVVATVLQGLQDAERPARLVDGHDLMASLHLQSGPLIGRLLEAVEEARAEGEATTLEEALAVAHRALQATGTGAPPGIHRPPEWAREGEANQ